MGFRDSVREDALVACARTCCICRKFKGLKIELHHIVPAVDGGADDFENCIPLCMDCHTDAGHYNRDHPKGSRYKPGELRRLRDEWYRLVKAGVTATYTEVHRRVDREIADWIENNFPRWPLESPGFEGGYTRWQADPVYQFLEDSSDVRKSFSNYLLEGLRLDLVRDLQKAISTISTSAVDDNPGYYRIAPKLSIDNPEKFDALLQKIYDLEQQAVSSYRTLIKEAQVRLAADESFPASD